MLSGIVSSMYIRLMRAKIATLNVVKISCAPLHVQCFQTASKKVLWELCYSHGDGTSGLLKNKNICSKNSSMFTYSVFIKR